HRPAVLPRYRARQSVSLVLPAFPDLLCDPLPAGGGLVDSGIPFDQPAQPGLVAGLQHADRLGVATDARDHGLGDLGELIAGGFAEGSRRPVAGLELGAGARPGRAGGAGRRANRRATDLTGPDD